MHKIFLILSICIAFSACNQKRSEETKADARDTSLVVAKPDSSAISTDAHYFWESAFDEKGNKMIMKKVRPIPVDSLTQEILISKINDEYADIKITFVRVIKDTIFIKAGNRNYLSKQMGSSGAETYMAEVTYDLTELPNINYVHFDFKKGDHASPGTYSRTDFIHPAE